jgi:hypothetical protein
MARMKRILITVDEDTLRYLRQWKLIKHMPASLVIREAVGALTRWKKAELAPKPESFEGVDQFTDGESVIDIS